MTPTKLLTCLKTFERVSRDGDYATWIAKKDAIIYLDVKKYISDFNNALEENGLGPIGLVPIAPSDTSLYPGGFGLAFPVGFWHGSFSTREDQASGKEAA